MTKYYVNAWGEIWTFTTDKTIKSEKIKYCDNEEMLNKTISNETGLLFDNINDAKLAVPVSLINSKIKIINTTIFDAIETLKTKVVTLRNRLDIKKLTGNIQTFLDSFVKDSGIKTMVGTNLISDNINILYDKMTLDEDDYNKIKTYLISLEQFQLNLFNGKKTKMEDFGGSIVWTMNDDLTFKEIEIHIGDVSKGQITIDSIVADIIKEIGSDIKTLEAPIDTELGIQLTNPIIKLANDNNIILERK